MLKFITLSAASVLFSVLFVAPAFAEDTPKSAPHPQSSVELNSEGYVGLREAPKTYSTRVNGNARQDADTVMGKALYKAAKQTLKKDYDWFRLVNQETEKDTVKTRAVNRFQTVQNPMLERRCGLLGCTTTRAHYRQDISAANHSREQTEYNVTLDYKMGYGTPPDSARVYDARFVKTAYKK